MKNNLYFIGLTSLSEFLESHAPGEPLYYSVGRQEIGANYGVIREHWTLTISDVQAGVCRYYVQTMGYTDKIHGEPFPPEHFERVAACARALREEIKQVLGKKFDLYFGGISFPKDLILREGSEIDYCKESNRFLFKISSPNEV